MAAPQLQTKEEGAALARAIQEGRVPDAKRDEALAALDDLRRRLDSPAANPPTPTQEMAADEAGKPTAWKDFSFWQYPEALWDVAAMGVTSMFAQPASGLVGAAAGAVSSAMGGDRDRATEVAARWQEGTERLLTDDPESPVLARGMQDLAKAFGWAANKAGIDPSAIPQTIDDTLMEISRPEVVNALPGPGGALLRGVRSLGRGEADEVFTKVVGESPEHQARKADDEIYAAANGSPEVAAFLKTMIYGMPSIVGLGRMNIPGNIKNSSRIKAELKRVEAEAKAQGIDVTTENLPRDVVHVAEKMVPNQARAANFDDVKQALRDARDVSAKSVDEAFEAANSLDAYVNTKPIGAVAARMRETLANSGVDVEKMPAVKSILKDVENVRFKEVGTGELRRPPDVPAPQTLIIGSERLGGKVKRTVPEVTMRMREVDILRRRARAGVKGDGDRVPYSAQDRALMRIADELDNTLDDQFLRGAVSGDASVQAAWRRATDLQAKHAATFDADRAFRNLMLQDATPEQVYQTLIGASAMGAKPQAGALLSKMKQVLGDNHPALTNVRTAALRDVLMPLLGDHPNFSKAVTRIDMLLKNNPSLVQELGIDVKELRRLRRATHAAQYAVAAHPERFTGEYITSVSASIMFGHSIARHGAIMRTARKVLNKFFGVGLISRGQLRKFLLEADTDIPVIEFGKPELLTWAGMTGSAAASSPPEE